MEVKEDKAAIYKLLEEVKDPEIPVLSVVDLGIVRDVQLSDEIKAVITITPTYSGCPAMELIECEIIEKLNQEGWEARVVTTLSPPWTTDWLSEAGRQKLEAYGIAPPAEATTDKSFLTGERKSIACPQCKSTNSSMISQFGSTACKALYRCNECLETFDYFKCI